MENKLNIESVENPEWGIIGGGIQNYNIRQAGDDKGKTFCFVVRDREEEIIGGIIGHTHWEWFYLDLMWLKEEFRGQGYGHQLITIAEEEARKLGAKNAYLDTFSFQAPEFYQKQGYQVFGELQDFPPGHTRYYLTKQL